MTQRKTIPVLARMDGTPTTAQHSNRTLITSSIRSTEDRFIEMESALEMEMFMLELGDCVESRIMDLMLCGISMKETARRLALPVECVQNKLLEMAPELKRRINGYEAPMHYSNFIESYRSGKSGSSKPLDLASARQLSFAG